MTPGCQQVVAALKAADNEMLAAGLPHALSAGIVQRHAYQEDLLDMTRQALLTGRSHAEEAKCAAIAALEAERSNMQVCTTNVEIAASEQAAAKDASKAKEAAHDGAVTAAAAAQENHTQAESVKQQVEEDMNTQRTKRDKAAAILDGPLSMLRDGGWGDAESCEDSITTVKEFLENMSVENALVAATAGALRLQPDQRRAFDKVIEEGVVNAFTSHVAKLEADLAEGKEEEEHSGAEALGLWAIWDEAKASASEAQGALEAACEYLKEATNKCSIAHGTEKQQARIVAKRETAVEVFKMKICDLGSALDTFELLRSTANDAAAEEEMVVDATVAGSDDVPMVDVTAEESCAAAPLKDCGVPPTAPAAVPLGGA